MDEDESMLSEITILPDGRVYAFGITESISDLLKSLVSREGSRSQQAEQAGEVATALPLTPCPHEESR